MVVLALILIIVTGTAVALVGAVCEHRRGVGREYGMVSLAARLWAWEKVVGLITVILCVLVLAIWG